MKKLIFLFFVLRTFSVHAQLKGEFTLGVLHSIDKNKYNLSSSSIQPVGVYVPTKLRFSNPGLRARAAVLKQINNTPINLIVQTGFNLRTEEVLWFQEKYTYLSIPIQAGVNCALLNKKSYTFNFAATTGINIFHLSDGVIRRQTGLLHNAEISYIIKNRGFFDSLLFKLGYELEIDNETFFYKPTEPYFKDEKFKSRVNRNQVYIAIGLNI